jgi:hypothetical protein
MTEYGWIKRSSRQLLAAAVTAAVFLLSAGSAGAAGTQVHAAGTLSRRSPTVVVEWHKLHLLHGWAEAAGPKFPVGNAA